MPRPFTTSQIERLGLRLGSTSSRAAEDIAQLHVLLAGYASALEKAVARVSAVTGLAPSSRVKNTNTILEKLERQGGASPKSMQGPRRDAHRA